MAEKTKPGDSLYIAKIVSEKTQYALTFDDKSKAQLGLQFATNRVEEMNKVLAEEIDVCFSKKCPSNEEKIKKAFSELAKNN